MFLLLSVFIFAVIFSLMTLILFHIMNVNLLVNNQFCKLLNLLLRTVTLSLKDNSGKNEV